MANLAKERQKNKEQKKKDRMTKGQIEAKISEAMIKFEKEFICERFRLVNFFNNLFKTSDICN